MHLRDTLTDRLFVWIVLTIVQVSRTYTYGRVGTHMGEGFDNHLGVERHTALA
jgi:hypothetical protein